MNKIKTIIVMSLFGLLANGYAQSCNYNYNSHNIKLSSDEISAGDNLFVSFDICTNDSDYITESFNYDSLISRIEIKFATGNLFSLRPGGGVKTIIKKVPTDSLETLGQLSLSITIEHSEKELFTINVVEKGTKKTVSDISGTWFDPNFSGAGFSVIQAANGLVFYYYGYADNGERLWLVSDVVDTTITKGQAITAKMYESADNNGANFTTKPTTEQSGVTDWGTIEFNVASCDAATAKLTGTDGDLALNLIKLANNQNAKCYD